MSCGSSAGTRGAPVVTGFLVVLLAFVLVSFLLKLKVLQYMLGAFSAFFILAVLVIFPARTAANVRRIGQPAFLCHRSRAT
jgi:ATP/ADP translocase